jgi:hypothetical protein
MWTHREHADEVRFNAMVEILRPASLPPVNHELRLQMGRRSLEMIQEFGYDKCFDSILKGLHSVVRLRVFLAMREQA